MTQSPNRTSLKSLSWTLKFSGWFIYKPPSFPRLKSGEIRFNKFIKKKTKKNKKTRQQLTEYKRLTCTNIYYLPWYCFHDKTHQYRRCRWEKKKKNVHVNNKRRHHRDRTLFPSGSEVFCSPLRYCYHFLWKILPNILIIYLNFYHIDWNWSEKCIKRPRWITYYTYTQGIKISKNYGNYFTFRSSKIQKHNKMLVKKFTLNTKDQGTVKITFEEKRTNRRNARQRHILLCRFWKLKSL